MESVAHEDRVKHLLGRRRGLMKMIVTTTPGASRALSDGPPRLKVSRSRFSGGAGRDSAVGN
jgi:hypothetical protein